MLVAACGLMALAVAISSFHAFHSRPRPWRPDEVPVAFWSWRNQTPSDTDVGAAIEQTKARAIFLRAGQIDYQNGKLNRIRPLNGPLPKGIELHLVYNATRSLLSQMESVDEKLLAGEIAKAFQEDNARAMSEDACVFGLQIDIDVPTRLLSRYEGMLRALRGHLPPGLKLSITGLPTWMRSAELRSTLIQVDFWVPQFYGAEIPARADQLIPISSPQDVKRFVNQAREIDKPFHAGLAAYSYVLLYSPGGALINIRGDLDPALIAADSNLELTDLRSFTQAGNEWRYAYRARADGVIDGLAMHAGDVLVVDSPSAESLRAAARIVRELAGEKLLGICVFRLPAVDDPATLTIGQVATSLADQDSQPNFQIRFTPDQTQPRFWRLEIENRGTSGTVGNLKIDLPLTTASIESVSTARGASIETICRFSGNGPEPIDEPCSQNRANLIRITAQGLRPGQRLTTLLGLKTSLSDPASVSIEMQTDAGKIYRNQQEIHLKME
jgi:hypothetical protein